MLIVDDSDIVLDFFLLFFQYFSTVKADIASQGQVSVNMCRERAHRKCCRPYKLILMDIHLGGMTGYDATAMIRQVFDRS